MSDERLTLRIANELPELTRVYDSVDAFSAAHDLPTACVFELNVALEELLTNTISYGYEDEQRGEIALDVAIEGDEILVALSDDARPFDPREAPPPDLVSSIADRRIGGLGVHLVKSLMDEIAYEYRDGRNHVRLRKRIVPK